MKIFDITGELKNGMWNYEPPFPQFNLKELPQVPWVKNKVWCEIFEGLHSQCGTYLETPAHFFGNDKSYLLNEVPPEKLIDIKTTLLMLPLPDKQLKVRYKITKEMLIASLGHREIEKGSAILIGCGWGTKWFDSDYLSTSPYFSKEAIRWLIKKQPFLLGSDLPRWENLDHPEGFFEDFYKGDILMLAPLINLENINPEADLLLTALPLKVWGTSCAPCRAIIKEL